MTGGANAELRAGFAWRVGDAFVELTWANDRWHIAYGFAATAKSSRRVVRESDTIDYADAVRQIRQVIAYYFAEPEHAERVRVELLTRAGLDPGTSEYLPLPDVTHVTASGGGAAGEAESGGERERRERILRGEPEPVGSPPPLREQPRAWWRRFGPPR